ncbi:MAG: prepilin-type N-terminal cleavage/methylation domain-containing protein [Candidatus Omnitrophica bacterium]|nr:prepilin-type N-terminal cleavage/methylation domain-containing protein [Candidatus Omnitrophota bacterium]
MRRKSFTLIELIVVIAIIGVLASILLPNIVGVIDKAKAAKAISTANILSTACDSYYMDTGQYAIEYATPWYKGATYHRLSFDPGINGWNGPYLKSPLSAGDNPWRNRVWMYNRTSGWESSEGGNGFDLDGDGTAETTASGNDVVFYAVPSSVAQLINNQVDGTNESSWQGQGKFEYRNNYYGCFYLTGGR